MQDRYNPQFSRLLANRLAAPSFDLAEGRGFEPLNPAKDNRWLATRCHTGLGQPSATRKNYCPMMMSALRSLRS